ncbi:MAG: DUF1826 domain-containing protein [Polyangiaceae bacterium]|nr:DUF1826 domain-containing protein [Polyangiaceae bacterium]
MLASRGSVRRVDDVSGIAELFDVETHVVHLRRRLSDRVAAEAIALVAQPGLRVAALTPLTSEGRAQLRDDRAVGGLSDELWFWAELMGELTGCATVGIRCARLDAPMCPRFHVDRVGVRLVTTLVGPGTEYVASEHVNRAMLGHAAGGASDDTSGLLRPGAVIARAEAGDVVLMKGESWPGNAGSGAVHRSPPTQATHACAPRLVVTIDPLA